MMYSVYEVFHNHEFWMHSSYDRHECEVWARNHATHASRNGWSRFEIREEVDWCADEEIEACLAEQEALL